MLLFLEAVAGNVYFLGERNKIFCFIRSLPHRISGFDERKTILIIFHKRQNEFLLIFAKGPFINYVRVSRGGEGLEKSLHTSTWGGGGQTHSYVIFSKWIFYISNRAVKWFGRDHVSFN